MATSTALQPCLVWVLYHASQKKKILSKTQRGLRFSHHEIRSGQISTQLGMRRELRTFENRVPGNFKLRLFLKQPSADKRVGGASRLLLRRPAHPAKSHSGPKAELETLRETAPSALTQTRGLKTVAISEALKKVPRLNLH